MPDRSDPTGDSLTAHEQDLQAAVDALRASQRLVVLTGAGISKESGIPTFRDAQEGLWARFDPQELATPRAFRRNPRLVWDWYAHRRAQVAQCAPNPGHLALVALEDLLPQVAIITQNTDGLHRAAGSTQVIALHGDMQQNKCFNNCQGDPTPIDITTLDWDPASGPPTCPHCGGWVRPAVVWFEENLPTHALDRALDLSQQADVMLVVGTSGVVQPAASLPYVALDRGATVIEINPAHTPITPLASIHLPGPSGTLLPAIVRRLKEAA